jgi:vacuolar-type H+-ATPase subunit I/STV1
MKPQTIIDFFTGALTVLQALVGVGFAALVYHWFAGESEDARLFAAFGALGMFWLGTLAARRARRKR